MTVVQLLRTSSGALVPLNDEEAAKIKRIKTGSMVVANLVVPRNGEFLKKWFVLAKFAFDIWSETLPHQEHRGVPVRPEFERFRKDLTIMCGYYRPVFDPMGGLHLEAESISFAGMDENRFEKLFSQTIQVILDKILASSKISEAQIREHVDTVLRFDS